MSSPPDPVKVYRAACITIERHGDRAIEAAQEILAMTYDESFTRAVIEEIRRLQEESSH